MPLLSVEELSISFRSGKKYERAVDRVSFELSESETLSLVGESGCGKTVTALTLLKLIPDPPGRVDGGKILFSGQDILGLNEKQLRKIRGKEIAMIFQEPMTSLNPVFTVGEQVAEGVRTHEGLGFKEAKIRALEAMDWVGIPSPVERYDQYPHQFSGGMRQRIMIAMALVCRPKILIADEPTTALDVTIQAQILQLLRRLRDEMKMSVLFISHDLSVISQVADRMAVMYAGVIVESGRTEDLIREPLHPYTQALYRAVPKQGENVNRLETIPGRVPALGQVPAHCRFYDRCSMAADECKGPEPELREIKPGHLVRCLRV